MALNGDNGAGSDLSSESVSSKSGNDAELTDDDRAMLDSIAEVAGPQAAEDADGLIQFDDYEVAIEGKRFLMNVTVELVEIEEGEG